MRIDKVVLKPINHLVTGDMWLRRMMIRAPKKRYRAIIRAVYKKNNSIYIKQCQALSEVVNE